MSRFILPFFVSAIVFIACCAVRSLATPAPTGAAKPAWEYKFLQRKDDWPREQEFSDLGQQGWELAGSMAYSGTTEKWIFKRRK